MQNKNIGIKKEDEAFANDLNAVFLKHGKTIIPEFVPTLRIVPLPPQTTAPAAAEAPTEAPAAPVGVDEVEAGAIASPIQAEDLGTDTAGSGEATA